MANASAVVLVADPVPWLVTLPVVLLVSLLLASAPPAQLRSVQGSSINPTDPFVTLFAQETVRLFSAVASATLRAIPPFVPPDDEVCEMTSVKPVGQVMVEGFPWVHRYPTRRFPVVGSDHARAEPESTVSVVPEPKLSAPPWIAVPEMAAWPIPVPTSRSKTRRRFIRPDLWLA